MHYNNKYNKICFRKIIYTFFDYFEKLKYEDNNAIATFFANSYYNLVKFLYFKRQLTRCVKKSKQRFRVIIFFNKSKIETKYKKENNVKIKKEKNFLKTSTQ